MHHVPSRDHVLKLKNWRRELAEVSNERVEYTKFNPIKLLRSHGWPSRDTWSNLFWVHRNGTGVKKRARLTNSKSVKILKFGRKIRAWRPKECSIVSAVHCPVEENNRQTWILVRSGHATYHTGTGITRRLRFWQNHHCQVTF